MKRLVLTSALMVCIYGVLLAQPNAYPYNEIGITVYDLQTNGSMQNRIFVYDDGTIGGVWTMGFLDYLFPDRGTGYNYYNGVDWLSAPTQRIENHRTGWPSYYPWGDNGEIIVSHNYSDTLKGLCISTRTNKGAGNWEEHLLNGPEETNYILWSKMVTSGEHNSIIDILALTYYYYLGQSRALLYYRSSDGGETWEIKDCLFPELDASHYSSIMPDQYAWAQSMGDTLAFVVGAKTIDLALMKSTDGGDSWQKTVVWEHPYPFFDYNVTYTDTFYCNDGAMSVLLDKSGIAHIAFGIDEWQHTPGSLCGDFLFADGIGYWNETMPTFSNSINALNPDSLKLTGNLIGWSQDINGNGQLDLLQSVCKYETDGISTMPYIAINEEHNIFLVYSSLTETYDNGNCNFRHLWLRSSFDNGNTWGDFYDLTYNSETDTGEYIYPSLSCNKYGDLKLICQKDDFIGTAVMADHFFVENHIWVIDLNEFTPPHSDFIADTTIVSSGDSILFQNLSEPATTWNWEFESGIPATFNGENPPYIVYQDTGHYMVKLTISGNGMSDYEIKENYIHVVESVFTPENNNPYFQIYPNPSKGKFTIATGFNGKISLTVFNNNGEMILTKTNIQTSKDNPVDINLGNAKAGTYLLQIESGSKIVSRKIIILK